MQDFVTYYINENYLTSICGFKWRQIFSDYIEMISGSPDVAMGYLKLVDYENWVYNTGPDPTGTLAPLWNTNTDVVAAINLANGYIALAGLSSPAGFAAYNTWPSNQ